ncbi:MAG TPA: SDR family oxidoreductase [Bacillota bacterium]|nr:SDR family oxidoreductase [Bacillota bacterium]
MNVLTNKTAVITGASNGIGKGIAKRLANEGVNVVLAARNKGRLDQLANELDKAGHSNYLVVPTDVAKHNDVEKLVEMTNETFGEVDIYINNAGAMLSAAINDGKVDEWDQMVDVNIKGVLYGINSILPDMKKRGTGHIVNLSSVSGHEMAKGSTVYSATKYAVRAISNGLEKELARTGVRVTNISPGMVNTRDRDYANRKPLETSDIAEAVVYALSQPDYVNVNEITVRPV